MSKPSLVDLDMLIMALQADDGVSWWLDTTSGEVAPGPIEEIHNGAETPISQYINIKPISSNVLPTLMEGFIATIDERVCCHKLQAALRHKQADWHFKQVLAEHPEFEDDWYAFKEQFYALQARQWLRDRDFEGRTVSRQLDITPITSNSPDTQAILLSVQIWSKPPIRYILWKPHDMTDELTLTAYDDEDRVLAETGINKNRLHVIENLLGQADHRLGAAHNHGGIKVILSCTTSDGEMHMDGYLYSGNWLDRLQSSLALTLGLPAR